MDIRKGMCVCVYIIYLPICILAVGTNDANDGPSGVSRICWQPKGTVQNDGDDNEEQPEDKTRNE